MSLEDRAREMKEHMASKANPADAPAKPERKRVPMTLPQQRLAAPEIPGYHTHWMLGTPERLAQAQDAGYEFVHEEESAPADTSLGGDGLKSGSSDMGTRVSKLANPMGGGEEDGRGQPLRLYLMKQKIEWYEEDQRILQNRNDRVVDALTVSYRTGTVGGPAPTELPADLEARYVDPNRSRLPELFKRKAQPRSS